MKKKKDKVDEFSKLLVVFLIGLIIIAITIAVAFKNSKYGGLLEIKDYFNFAGSFGGAILSASISFFILFITIESNKSEQQESMLNLSRPVLKVQVNFASVAPQNERNYYAMKDVNQNRVRDRVKDRVSLEIKNIGTGPARKLTIKIGDFTVTRYTGLIEKLDIGVGEHLIINISAFYTEILENDKEGNGISELVVTCKDIFDKRLYEYKFNLIKEAECTNIQLVEMIEENIIDITKKES